MDHSRKGLNIEMRQILMNSSAYLKLLPMRTIRIAAVRPVKRTQLSPSFGGLGSVLNQPSLVVTRQLEMLNVLMGYEVLIYDS